MIDSLILQMRVAQLRLQMLDGAKEGAQVHWYGWSVSSNVEIQMSPNQERQVIYVMKYGRSIGSEIPLKTSYTCRAVSIAALQFR